jgi:hypothetical protein
MSDLPVKLSLIPGMDGEPAEGPQAAAPGRPAGELTRRDQVSAALTLAVRNGRQRAGDLRKREGGLWHGIRTGKPASIEEQARYVTSRPWVPPGHEGGLAEAEGVLFYLLIGNPLHKLGLFIAWAGQRQFHFWGVFAVFAVTVLPVALWLLL